MLPLARALLFSWAALAAFGSSRQTARDDSDYTVLPVVFDGRYGYPSVPVTIQATRIPLAFDLGGSKLELALSPALLRQHDIAVSYTGKVVHGEDARGVKSTYREFILPEVHLADFALENIRGVEYHPWGGRGAPKNGIVGFDLIAKFNVVIDFSKSRIALIRGTTFPPGYDVAAWPKVPFTADGHMLTVRFHSMHQFGKTGIALQQREVVNTVAASEIEQDQRHEHLCIAPALAAPPNPHMPIDRRL